MKKILLTILLSCLAMLSARADLIWYEGFNYPDGQIITNSTNWARHSGTGNDALVKNHKLEVAATGGVPVTRSDDIHRNFPTFTNTLTQIYASFTVNVTNFPNANGTYFAHFLNGSSTFYGKVFALTGNPGTSATNFTGLPGTFRLGTSGALNAPNKIFPVDLATNTDYQVVITYDPINQDSQLWLNPLSSGDASVTSGDTVTGTQQILQSFGTRQASSFGNFFCTISNMATATTFDEAATNVWSRTPVAPTIVYQPKGFSNFVGVAGSMSAVANGQSLGNLTYQWLQNGAPYSNPNGNSNVLSFPSPALSDTGDYTLVVGNPTTGLSATSAVAHVSITFAPIPPTITQQPTNTAVYSFQTATLHVAATGPGPIFYTWSYNSGPLGPNAADDGAGNLTITDVETNNGTAGTYSCIVSNQYGAAPVSSNAVVSVIIPPAVSIAFLRSLVDTNYLATNSTTLYQATGTVTTFTNATTGNTASYYIQDGTAGVNIFVTGGQTFRPNQGDVVTFIGFQSSFQANLELEADPVNNPTTTYSIIATNAPLPAPKVIPYSLTNSRPATEAIMGSLVMLTNVYFGTNAGAVLSTNTAQNVTAYVVTNASGQPFTLSFASVDLDTGLQTLPSFAWTVSGPLVRSNNLVSVLVTRFADIVTDAPPAVTLGTSHPGGSSTLTWTAVPYSYAYSVLAATTVTGPYTPIASGLVFTNSLGSYTDPNGSAATKFYKVSSP